MIDQLIALAKYQKWANERFRTALSKLNFNELLSETPYGPLLDVVVHIFGAIELWLERLKGNSPKTIRSYKVYSEWANVAKDWEQFDNALIEAISQMTDNDLKRQVKYISTEGYHLETSVDNILLQLLCHHQSYHRGQIAMFLRQKGFEPVKETDYIYYVYD